MRTLAGMDASSAEFAAVARELGEVRTRPEIAVRAAPGPTKLAPYALALTATVDQEGDDVADGRLVVLHDPAGQDAWQGTWRIVLFASAQLDEAMAGDPVLVEMGWSWLQEALGDRGLAVTAFGGTVTRTSSQSFGVLADRPATGELQIRASWTPVLESPQRRGVAPRPAAVVREHVAAWIDLLGLITSLEPEAGAPGIHRLPTRR